MKLPNVTQGVKFGKIIIARSDKSGYPRLMERDPISQLIAANLTRLMEQRGMSALALAEKCRMGRSSVYDIVQGRSASPKISTVAKLAEGLGVPLSVMFLTQQELEAQSELLQTYNRLPLEEQRRLARVARAWRLD